MWQSQTYSSAEEAAAAAAQAHGGASTAGVHFAVEWASGGWFWFPLPGSPLAGRLGRASRAAEAEAAALRGEIPKPPAISVEAKSYTYAKACLRFYDAARRGDREALRQGRIFGVSTHALLVRRYQRALLVALNIGEKA